jgi:L-malate glycosyltransferase
MPSKILVVGHTYMVDANREKFRALCRLHDDIDVTVVTPTVWKDYLVTLNAETSESDRLHFVTVPTYLSGYESLYFYRPRSIEQVLERAKPDIIHVEQGANAFSYYQILRLKRRVCPEAKVLFFTWINLPYTQNFVRDSVENYNLSHSDCAIAGNNDAEEILRDRGFTKPIFVCPQIGVDPAFFAGEREQGEDSVPVLGFVGRFVEEKGIHTLLSALEGLKHLRWKLLLVGRGDLKELILERAKRCGISDRLEIVDAVPHDEVPAHLRRMDVFVLPSETTPLWKEQFGHVLIEAMVCGLPVIGSDSGEIPNVIGEAGLVFRERDAADLRSCLERMIEDKALRLEYGSKGEEHVRVNYTHEAIAERNYAVYERLLEA